MDLPLPTWMHDSMARWERLWGMPGLSSQVTVEFSSRMTRSLGRCYPARRRIRIAVRLLQGPRPILREALCHELAHIAVHEMDGGKAAPHGPAWAELMRTAGFEPRTRLRHPDNDTPSTVRGTRRPVLYVHRCPVCQMERTARRPVRRWLCSACIEAGLDGRLEIHRRPARGAP